MAVRVREALPGGRQVLTVNEPEQVPAADCAAVMTICIFGMVLHLYLHQKMVTLLVSASALQFWGAVGLISGVGCEWVDVFMAEQSFACDPLTLLSSSCFLLWAQHVPECGWVFFFF